MIPKLVFSSRTPIVANQTLPDGVSVESHGSIACNTCGNHSASAFATALLRPPDQLIKTGSFAMRASVPESSENDRWRLVRPLSRLGLLRDHCVTTLSKWPANRRRSMRHDRRRSLDAHRSTVHRKPSDRDDDPKDAI